MRASEATAARVVLTQPDGTQRPMPNNGTGKENGATVEGVPVLGTIDRLRSDLEHSELDQVWIALPLRAEERIRRLVAELRAFPVQVRYVPDIFGFQLLRHSFSEVAGMPVIGSTTAAVKTLESRYWSMGLESATSVAS